MVILLIETVIYLLLAFTKRKKATLAEHIFSASCFVLFLLVVGIGEGGVLGLGGPEAFLLLAVSSLQCSGCLE